MIHYKKVILEKFATYSETDGVIKRVKLFADYAWSIALVTYVVFSSFAYSKIYTDLAILCASNLTYTDNDFKTAFA